MLVRGSAVGLVGAWEGALLLVGVLSLPLAVCGNNSGFNGLVEFVSVC